MGVVLTGTETYWQIPLGNQGQGRKLELQMMNWWQFHSLYHVLSTYYLMHMWTRFTPDSLAYGAESHDSLRDTFASGWIPNVSC